MKKRYYNARESLPPELFEQLIEHVDNCYLWVSSTGTDAREKRNREIMRLYVEGLATREIADRVHLKPRRVRQIIREMISKEQDKVDP